MQIGTLQLPHQALFLAPMEDVTDPSFRYMCKQYGADMVYTEFVASEALVRQVNKTERKLVINHHERPIGIQLYGHNIDAMVNSAIRVAEAKPDVIDINYGCPVKKIATRGAGAGMLRDIPKMIEMTRQIVQAVTLPVTVKTRLGWDEDSKNIVEIAEQLQDTGIQALTIHGRTRAQMYKGQADWSLIEAVKNNPRMHIPIIGNGDVIDGPSAARRFRESGVDGIMIGRATFGKPWIFKEIKHYLQTGKERPPMPISERVAMAKLHLKKSLEWKGDKRGIYEMRRHFSTYFKALPHFKNIRIKLVTSMDVNEINDLLDHINQAYADFEFPHSNTPAITSCEK